MAGGTLNDDDRTGLTGLDLGSRRLPDGMVTPLGPRWWRGALFSAPYQRVRGFGARYIVVISDLWGYPGANSYGRRPPWEDLDAWSAFVRRLAREHRDHDLIWDVWNEPDHPYFLNGTMQQFHRTYAAPTPPSGTSSGLRRRVSSSCGIPPTSSSGCASCT